MSSEYLSEHQIEKKIEKRATELFATGKYSVKEAYERARAELHSPFSDPTNLLSQIFNNFTK